ncbi:MAG: hypothetical protein ACREFX_08335, partial [Opitutaceae bacterium]
MAQCTVFGATFALCGCVSVSNIGPNKTSVTRMKRVAVLAIREPRTFQVVNFGGAASAFGAIGGLVQGLTNAEHSKSFLAAMHRRKVSMAKPMLAALERSLRRDGYEVSVDDAQQPKKASDGGSADFSGIHVDADSILIVRLVTVGYMSPPDSVHYEPWVLIQARMLDA